MKKVLILGAYGATAQIVIERLLNETDDQLVLYLRNSSRLSRYANNDRITIIDGDVQDVAVLKAAMQKDIDIVYSNVGGINLDRSAKPILDAMQQTGQKRLIFYSALGALHEVPGAFGRWNEETIQAALPGLRKSDRLIKVATAINTTQLRPAWLTNYDEVDYEITAADEPFKGTEVSRKSVADVIIKIINDPTLYQNDSIGINKPNTDGDKPAWL
ncbi:NAD(P)H-binding protein [Fructilactobacillus florum]|uniref:NAD(P)H-binding protein n=1 Tax=Fructilactobacillus florum TaxID=640331 RepID=UPI00028D8E34|nr:NAD(P)H-binding protein [Fructilactobacillus florum]EKK21041.1 oxidoreductase (putative) [Fructilactobacillus florum 2F]